MGLVCINDAEKNRLRANVIKIYSIFKRIFTFCFHDSPTHPLPLEVALRIVAEPTEAGVEGAVTLALVAGLNTAKVKALGKPQFFFFFFPCN